MRAGERERGGVKLGAVWESMKSPGCLGYWFHLNELGLAIFCKAAAGNGV